MIIDDLAKRRLINPPSFVESNSMYVTVMGSHAYGVADTAVKSRMPDLDVYGFCIPPRGTLFPQTEGHIIAYGEKPGTVITFGSRPKGFEQWIKHHVWDQDAHGGRGQEYDFTVYNIVKYFELCRQGNPNMVDSLFTREECVLHCTQIGRMVRDSRNDFLSKSVWKTFRGYAYSQLHKMESKETVGEAENFREMEKDLEIPHRITLAEVESVHLGKRDMSELAHLSQDQLTLYYNEFKKHNDRSSRFEHIKRNGYDCKFAYHVLRLLDEAEQVLLTGDLDLQRAKEVMKSVRRGEWKPEDIRSFFVEKERALEAAYLSCKLPDEPDEGRLKNLLLNCLEEHYGTLSNVFENPSEDRVYLQQIKAILEKAQV